MLRKISHVALACALSLGVILVSGLAAGDEGRPRGRASSTLRVDRDVVDVGDVLLGERVQFHFELTNPSSTSQSLEVHATCGCTVAKHDREISAGKSSKLTAELNTTGLPLGPLQKTLLVGTAGESSRPLTLTLKANLLSIVERLDEERRPLALNDRKPTTREIRLRLRGDPTIQFTGATCNLPQATATLAPFTSTVDAGRLYKLRVTIDPAAPRGRTPLTVQLGTTSAAEKSVFVNLTLEKGILATPGTIVFKTDIGRPRSSTTATIQLARRDGAFRIAAVESPDFQLESAIEVVRQDQEYRIRLTSLGAKNAENRRRPGVVRVLTDDPDQRVVEIRAIAVLNEGTSDKLPRP